MNALPSNIALLKPYASARSLCKGEEWIFMDANESPVPGTIQLPSLPPLNRYPDPTADVLRDAVAVTYGIGRENLVIGNGSDELIDLCVRAFVRPGRSVVSVTPTYGMYEVSSAIHGSPFSAIPLAEDLLVDVSAFLGAAVQADLIFLCSPNNPTGLPIPGARLKSIVKDFPGIVVVDEAYGEFADDDGIPSAIEMVKDGADNLLVLRTFSKAFGVAGIRLGYAIGPCPLIDVLLRIKPPYNVSAVAQAAGSELWRDRKTMQARVARLRSAAITLMQVCDDLGCTVMPSLTNFFLMRPPDGRSADDLLLCLREEYRIVLRRIKDTPVLTNFLRITVGTDEQNRNLFSALSFLLSQ